MKYNNKVEQFSGFVEFVTFKTVKAITLAPFGIYIRNYKDLNNKKLINHESIHYQQQRELLYIFFYILYFFEWFIKLFRKENAYRDISFEREAFDNEANLEYLDNRKPFRWLYYFFGRDKKRK